MNRIEQLIKAVNDAVESQRVLPETILSLEGMSGIRYRNFINNLIADPIVKNYLEIGVWKGSTAIAALYGNVVKLHSYWTIDNWAEFSGPRNEYVKNFADHVGADPHLIDGDCFAVNLGVHDISDVDVYFYDGGHDREHHRKAVTHYLGGMKDSFIFLVDDWAWEDVKNGTFDGIKQAGLTIDFQLELMPPPGIQCPQTWWNGVGIFVLSK